MTNNIKDALLSLFDKRRIVFWYDPNREMRSEFEELLLNGIEKLEINNNEYGLKYKILREEPKSKFLLYHEGKQPEKLDNWLLDVQLANAVFSADQISLWMAELELGPEYSDLVREHQDFFAASSRREALKARDIKQNDHQLLRLKMMAVCIGASVEPAVENITLGLLNELANNSSAVFDTLEKYQLLPHLYRELETLYHYKSTQPHINDFAIHLFESCYQQELGLEKEAALSTEAIILMNHWQDSQKYKEAFETLSTRFADNLNIHQDLEQYNIQDLISVDVFRDIDFRILELLMEGVIRGTITEQKCKNILQSRAGTYWFSRLFETTYQAIYTASELLNRLLDIHFEIDSIEDGIRKYTNTWFKVDQLYRNYLFLTEQSNQTTFFKPLNALVEKHYCNNFLKPINNNWQLVVDREEKWIQFGQRMQLHFYQDNIEPILQQNTKAAVIISDALRYEIGEEISKKIEREGRFTSEIEPMLGCLPSYTQLGMATLLPHDTLEIQPDGSVTADGMSASGTENRWKILAKQIPGNSTVLLSPTLRNMTHDERRALFRDNQVVYVFHNHIDAVGDSLMDERRTPEAVSATIDEIIDLVKDLSNANFTKIFVTADHGFLYQHDEIDESDFAVTDIKGERIYSRNRRYIVGEGLQKQMSLKHFTAEQVGLAGDYEVLIAKSINRMRLQGSGSRFVHGGASLQEIVIPVIRITKERSEDAEIRFVEVDKINGLNNKITTGQISIAFYQTEPVSPKVLGRTLRVGVFAKDGQLISEVHTLSFNFNSENPRDREIKQTFQLTSSADQYNKQIVYLRLEELIPNTIKYQTIKEWPYKLDRAPFSLF